MARVRNILRRFYGETIWLYRFFYFPRHGPNFRQFEFLPPSWNKLASCAAWDRVKGERQLAEGGIDRWYYREGQVTSDWIWNLKLKLETETWNWNLKMQLEVETFWCLDVWSFNDKTIRRENFLTIIIKIYEYITAKMKSEDLM